jgi:choline dehydrogenase
MQAETKHRTGFTSSDQRSTIERLIGDATVTYWHQTCTAQMGRDTMSVVDKDSR